LHNQSAPRAPPYLWLVQERSHGFESCRLRRASSEVGRIVAVVEADGLPMTMPTPLASCVGPEEIEDVPAGGQSGIQEHLHDEAATTGKMYDHAWSQNLGH